MGVDYKEIQPQLSGMWTEILLMYGIDVGDFKGLNTKNQPCPCCGGTDRAHWREQQGRVALFCRGCCPDSMKSPEDVIMETTNIGFYELVDNLADFINHIPIEKIHQAKVKAKAMPKCNMPPDHKQDHIAVEKFLESCEWCHSVDLLGRNAPNPQELPTKNNTDYWVMYNKDGIAVNLVKYINDQPVFLAGGISYGCLYSIKGGKRLIITTNPIDGILCWYKTKATILIAFTDMNLRYCMAKNKEISHAVVCSRDKEFLKDFIGDHQVRILTGDAYGKGEQEFKIKNP